MRLAKACSFFFFNDTATTEIYTLSLHDALPISGDGEGRVTVDGCAAPCTFHRGDRVTVRADYEAASDRKSTRLNSSHANISYAVFCLKKKMLLPGLRFHLDPDLLERFLAHGNVY